jgi:hypothetical protein
MNHLFRPLELSNAGSFGMATTSVVQDIDFKCHEIAGTILVTKIQL